MVQTAAFPPYALLTAARNEAAVIEKTLRSVIAQTVPPSRWIIVSDRSEDDTDSIVLRYAAAHTWITLVRRTTGGRRSVGSKVACLNQALAYLNEPCQYIGSLDADVSFDPDYFENLLSLMESDHSIGLAGGHIWDKTPDGYKPQLISDCSVAGAVQFFRCACFAQVGPWRPFPFGGEDAALEITARFLGWRVLTVRSLKVLHHRPLGMGTRSTLAFRLRQGRMDWSLGYDPVFEAARCTRRLSERPFLIGAALRWVGYLAAAVRGEPVLLPAPVVRFLRAEQRRRMCAGSEPAGRISKDEEHELCAVSAGS